MQWIAIGTFALAEQRLKSKKRVRTNKGYRTVFDLVTGLSCAMISIIPSTFFDAADREKAKRRNSKLPRLFKENAFEPVCPLGEQGNGLRYLTLS